MDLRSWARRALGPSAYDEVEVARQVLPWPGVMVDVGAHHGQSLLPFVADGWEVYAFEPDPRNRAVLEQNVAGLASVHVDGRAIAEEDGLELDLYISDVSQGISTLKPFHESHQQGARVTTVRLDSFLSHSHIGAVTFLKSDAEGFDLPVLRTFPWDELHPLAVVCEFENRKTAPLGYTYEDIASYLVDLGYTVFTSEWYPIVQYGAVHRWRGVNRYPCALADEQGWGNLVAVAPHLAKATERALQRAGRRLAIRRQVNRLTAAR